MSSSFDAEAFLTWLDDYDGPVKKGDLAEEWSDFPLGELNGCTGPIIDGDFAYYQRDLRRVAEGRPILD